MGHILGIENGDGPSDPRTQLVEWSRAAAPREACGFLFGSAHACRFDVRAVMQARNRIEADDEFLFDPADIVRADRCARASGLQLLGFWHSHPHAPAIPSAHDVRAAWPGHLCVIVSLCAEPAIRAWSAVDGSLVEIAPEALRSR